MDQRYLQNNIFSQPYSRSQWQEVLKTVFGVSVLYSPPRQIPLSNADIASEAFELGNFYTLDERLVGVYEINLNSAARTKLAINKVGLRSLLRNVYKYDVDGALIVFAQKDKWRFSYVSEIRTEEGKVETEPKRYTYLFGKDESCRTAAERFSGLKGKKLYLQDLFDAFSVEKLNQDFFNGYYEFYRRGTNLIVTNKEYCSWLLGKTEKDDDTKQRPIRDYVKKLLGRIVFLHFLQKKGWMGVPASLTAWENGDKQFMQSLFKNYPKKDKFNSRCLHSLFFETLNTNRIDNNFLAPEKLFSRRDARFRIPYLNGGLFDNSEVDNLEIDFPSDYFAGLLDFFEQYNFTIDENDPYESEVGIDPEMLGHIFENLLEENRERGTFYTPKEIVYYICHEGLIEYLLTQMPEIDRCDFELLVRQNRVVDKFTDHRIAQNIHDKLCNVKICDPAIGSGAFPMGMLKEIFECRRLLYPYLRTIVPFDPAKIKKEIIERNIYGVDVESGAADIARLRFWLALVVDEDEPQPLPNLDYKIMQGNSLLESFEGIDLSRVLKSDVGIFEPDRDLFGNIKENQLKFTYAQSKIVEEIRTLTRQFYRLEDAKEKQIVRQKIGKHVHDNIQFNIDLRVQQIERLIAEIEESKSINPKQEKKLKDYTAQRHKLHLSHKKLQELENSSEKPFFLWHLFFDDAFVNGGFDIVIGNPPYIQLQKMGSEADALQEAGFETFARTGDIYCLFYEQAHKILKEGGNLIFITGSAWLRSNYGKALRKFFVQKTNPIQLIDLSDSRIFQSATVLTTIFQFKKSKNENKLRAVRLTRRNQHQIKSLSSYLMNSGSIMQNLDETVWSVNDKDKGDIKFEVKRQGTALKNWNIEINYGIKTGLNEAFVVNEAQKTKLIKESASSKTILKPFLRGRDLSRYSVRDESLWLISTFPSLKLDINDFPAIKRYLLAIGRERLEQSGEPNARKKTGNKWFETQDQISYWELFELPKIVYPGMVKDIAFAYDERSFYANDKCFIISGEKLKYLLAILNSKLFRFCFEEDFPELQGNSREIKSFVMREIPIKYPSAEQEGVINGLVDYLIYLYDPENEALLKHTPNIRIASVIEDVINMVVYELYFGTHTEEQGLTVVKDLRQHFTAGSENRSKAILGFYKWLQLPENKVRNKILALDIKSPDLLSRINSSSFNSPNMGAADESD